MNRAQVASNLGFASLLLLAIGVALFYIFTPGNGSAHWIEAQVLHSTSRQQELICDSTGQILAAVQPDDGGTFVLWGADRIAYGTYIDMESAKTAGNKLRFKCP